MMNFGMLMVDIMEFDQFLGWLAFLLIIGIGFWLMIFLASFVVPYWIVGEVKDLIKEKKEEKRKKKEQAELQSSN